VSSAPRTIVALTGVAETLLWTLYFRALEAPRPDRVLDDPLACALVDAIDCPFEARFGDSAFFGQVQALRARRFDQEVRRFLAQQPDATVVALGEGLETAFWRIRDERVRWLSIDVPEVAELPERLLGATLVFDAVPRWFSAATLRARKRERPYEPPPMPWGLDAGERKRVRAAANASEIVDLRLPRGRGLLLGWAAPLAMRLRRVRAVLPSITRVRFAGSQ
jgi:Leucine carboxyl methyltransferase